MGQGMLRSRARIFCTGLILSDVPLRAGYDVACLGDDSFDIGCHKETEERRFLCEQVSFNINKALLCFL